MIKIGQQFAEERHKQDLTIEEVSRATKIREEFLRAIEKGDFKALPSSAYAHGFVSNYAKFLGLPVERSLAIFRREFDGKKETQVLPRGLTGTGSYSVPRFKIGRTSILIGTIFIIVALFLLFQYRSALFDPSLKVDYPRENETINSLTVETHGKTDSNATLLIESREVPIENDGSFKKDITVFPGNTSINYEVRNRFGRITTLKRNIIVKPGS